MTGAELRRHAYELADELGVRIYECATCDPGDEPEGASFIDSTGAYIVLSHSPSTPESYLLALHELGHLAHQRGKRVTFLRWSFKPRLWEEAMAWRWAICQSQLELGPVEWGRILWRLKSYGDDRRLKRVPEFDSLIEEAYLKAQPS